MQNKVLPIQIGETIRIPMRGLSPALERKIHERLVFTNPEYERRHNAGLWIGNIPATISCIRKVRGYYLLPRGFLYELLKLCQKMRQPCRIIDIRRSFPSVDINFHGYLKEYQQEAAEAVLEKDFATLLGGYKSGKTVISIYTISERKQPTLVIIPKLELLESWIKKIQIFLQIPINEIGFFIQNKKKIGSKVTIAHTSEVLRHWEELRDNVGYLILDDANRCPPKIITQIISHFDTTYMLALCQEMDPGDKHFDIITLYIGDVVYSIDTQSAREGCGVIKADIIAKATNFSFPYHSRVDYLPMLQNLMEDKNRTETIIRDVEEEINQGSFPIALITGGPIQEEIFYKAFTRKGYKAFKFMVPYDIASSNNDSETKVPELNGFDIIILTPRSLATYYSHMRHIKTLFFAIPLYFNTDLLAALQGLVKLRESTDGNGKEELASHEKLRIFDYVDKNIGLLENYFRMRSYNYGFPAEILLRK